MANVNRRILASVVLACMFTFASPAITLGEEPTKVAGDAVDKIPEVIDPYGRPKRFIQGKHRMYGIWYEDGAWRLRTTSGRRVKVGFHGTVQIDKDKIIPDYTALDRVKKRKDSDLVILSKNRQQMKFRFVTVGWTDGIDFKVGKKAKTVTFDLRTAGDDDPRFILIGGKGVNPAKGKFTFPAHPPKPPITSKEPPFK